jgi:8-oxo-dGTP diphosphatase
MNESGRAWYCPSCEAFSRTKSIVAEDDGTCANCCEDKLVEINLTRPTVGVGVLIARGKTAECLLGKRGPKLDKAGTWQLPSGSIEHGETIEVCARREVKEETGITDLVGFEVLRVMDDIRPEGDVHHIIIFCCCRTTQEPENVEPDKCDGWRWFDEGALPSPLFKPLRALLVDELGGMQYLSENGGNVWP